MPTARTANQVPTVAWQGLPQRLRVLHICDKRRTGGWLADALAHDSAVEIELCEAVGSTAGLSRLRDEVFDAVLVTHDPGELDALDLTEGFRAGGADEPIIILGSQSEQEMAVYCYEAGADGYVCIHTGTTRGLIWMVTRAVQHHRLLRENRRLVQAERQRLQREHEEAERLLRQQRQLIADVGTLSDRLLDSRDEEAQETEAETSPTEGRDVHIPGLPDELVVHYRELLRAYVIMGSGNLAGELGRLAEMFAVAGVGSQQVMQLHVHVVGELIRGLGARSSRHVMSRADLLALEIMIHLAEAYRLRYYERAHPPRQPYLPGFEEYFRL
ncbi:hypothetical protein JCM19992_33580 [Thermostilla marina]